MHNLPCRTCVNAQCNFGSSFCARLTPHKSYRCTCSTVQRVCGARRIACHICTSAGDSTWSQRRRASPGIGDHCAALLIVDLLVCCRQRSVNHSWIHARDLAFSTCNFLQPRPHDACRSAAKAISICFRLQKFMIHYSAACRKWVCPPQGSQRKSLAKATRSPVLQRVEHCGLNQIMGQAVRPEAEDGSAPVLPAEVARSSHQSLPPDAAGKKQPEVDAIPDDYRVGYSRTCGCFAEVSPWAAKVRCQGGFPATHCHVITRIDATLLLYRPRCGCYLACRVTDTLDFPTRRVTA